MSADDKTGVAHEHHGSVVATGLQTTSDIERIEAPVTWKAYLICAFASIGGIFFGYDSGYINGVEGSSAFYQAVDGSTATALTNSHQSLIVSILSAGTFFGAIIAGDVAEFIGRKWTVIIGCLIYVLGVCVQVATTPNGSALGTMTAGRFIAGLGVGFESAIVILYMSEIVSCPSCPASRDHPADRDPSELVPPKGPRCSGCGLPILHHDWSSACLLRRLRHPEVRRPSCLPHSHRHPVHMGLHPRHRPLLPPRFSPLLRQARSSRRCYRLPLASSGSAPRLRVYPGRARRDRGQRGV